MIKEGDFHRLVDNKEAFVVLFVSRDKSKALLIGVKRLSHGNPVDIYAKLSGLDEEKRYLVDSTLIPGSLLVKGGYLLPFTNSQDYEAVRVYIEEK